MNELQRKLENAKSVMEKIAILDLDDRVARCCRDHEFLSEIISQLEPDSQLAVKSLIAIGQFDRVVGSIESGGKLFQDLLDKLRPIDSFYREMGGIVGYHETVLSLLSRTLQTPSVTKSVFHSPSFIDISELKSEVREAILWGIDAMPQLGEIYPLGGAADRLHLVDPQTGSELPAAKLQFAGISLLERLIRDLQAREYLYFKIYGKQITTPIAIMTSLEKNNHNHVLQILDDHGRFGRTVSSIRLFTQPLVPVVNSSGDWCLSGPMKPVLKPGGHGAIWKLACDEGIFSWFQSLGRKKVLVRQINNPVAGLDYGLFAFTGIGCERNMKFGFASCPRLIGAAEGVNVLVERKVEGKSTLVLTNIEYCDFVKFGIQDTSLNEGSPYSRFSSNTNILFADLRAVEEAVRICPFPGLLVNLKNQVLIGPKGEKKEELIARLESTMQNIADVFVEDKQDFLATRNTFVTYNHRHKTIATAKRAFVKGGNLQETPENCFYEMLKAARELLSDSCGFALPSQRSLAQYLNLGPEFVFLYHPALGPLYSIIQQKICGGSIALGSEWVLEVVDAEIENLNLKGSLRIMSDQPIGHFDQDKELCYSDRTGRCRLRNVTVSNRGVDWESSIPFWKGEYTRYESLDIHLKGCSEFVAENVIFEGYHRFEIEDGMRLIVSQGKAGLVVRQEPISNRPFWVYRIEQGEIQLTRGVAR